MSQAAFDKIAAGLTEARDIARGHANPHRLHVPPGLTARQRDLYVFVERHIARFGIAPTFEEMMKAVAIRSKSSVHRLLTCLEDKGFLRRMPGRTRGIEIVSRDNAVAADRRALVKLAELASEICDADYTTSPDLTMIPLLDRLPSAVADARRALGLAPRLAGGPQ